MNWQNLEQFLAMGGYAPYVWGSFGAVAALLAVEVLALRLRRRSALRALALHDGAGAAS